MNILESFRVAMRGLISNKMRAALTMLGIIIGVSVVILVVAIGQGATQRVTDTINSLGTNLLTIRPGPPRIRLTAALRSSTNTSSPGQTSLQTSNATNAPTPNHLTLDDATVMANHFKQTIDAVAPQARGNIQIRYGSNTSTTSLLGITLDYPYVNNAPVDRGRYFTQGEIDGRQKVCVVGTTVAEKLTQDAGTDLTGQTISINSNTFTVVGMLTPKGSGAFGQDQDDMIVIPITTALRRVLNHPYIDMISVRCTTQDMMPLAQQQIESLLRNRHHIQPPYPDSDDFKVFNQTELLASQQSVTGTMTALLSAVALISLIVGGIGIMNIMLVSVTERTREIGIRKAIGATPRDILMQFLIESAIISLLGGIIGILVGIGGAIGLAAVAGWPTIVSTASVVVALFVSAGVGLFFGIYPAGKAAALHPIDALRYE